MTTYRYSVYPTALQDFSFLHVFTCTIGNSVDSDRLASMKPVNLVQ